MILSFRLDNLNDYNILFNLINRRVDKVKVVK